jgi:hypothetical protein
MAADEALQGAACLHPVVLELLLHRGPLRGGSRRSRRKRSQSGDPQETQKQQGTYNSEHVFSYRQNYLHYTQILILDGLQAVYSLYAQKAQSVYKIIRPDISAQAQDDIVPP